MNQLFQDSLRKLESKLNFGAHHEQHSAANGDGKGLLLEIVSARHADRETQDLSSLPVWIVASVVVTENAPTTTGRELKTAEKDHSQRLLGSLHNSWRFNETMFVPKNGKVNISLMIRCHSSTPSGAFELEDKLLASVCVSTSQLTLGEARDFSLICSDVDHNQTDDGDDHVGSVTVRLYDPNRCCIEELDARRRRSIDTNAANSVRAAASRAALGTIQVTVWQGKSINTSCPCFIALDIPDAHRKQQNRVDYPQRYRTETRPNPHNPVYDFVAEFFLYSLQGNIVLELWEENVTRDIQLGQICVPICWLTDRLSGPDLVVESSGGEMMLSGWFEVFPCVKPTRYNRGGAYLPYVKGVPQSTGFGMTRPSTPIGFVRLDITLTLREPILQTILRNPWAYRPEREELDDEEEAGLSSILVTAYALLRTFKLLKNPPFFAALFDILNWKAPFPVCVCVLYTVAYTALLARPWQYPLFVLLIVIVIGKTAGDKKRFSDLRAFSGHSNKTAGAQGPADEHEEKEREREREFESAAGATAVMAGDNGQGAAETSRSAAAGLPEVGKRGGGGVNHQRGAASSPPPKSGGKKDGAKQEGGGSSSSSISEQYKHMKREALRMEKSVQSTCSKLERYSNLLCWGDPILSGITALLALGAAALGSLALLFLTPNQALFFVCLSLFMPKEIQDVVLRSLTSRVRRVIAWILRPKSKQASRSGKSGLSAGEDDAPLGENDLDDDELHHHHHQQQQQQQELKELSYTRWLKLMARRWIRMVPDDFDMMHKYIAAAAFITRDQEIMRLPTKTKVLRDDDASSVGGVGAGVTAGGGAAVAAGLGALDEVTLFKELWAKATASASMALPATTESAPEPPLPTVPPLAAQTSAQVPTSASTGQRPKSANLTGLEGLDAQSIASRKLAVVPKSIGEVYRERRRSQYLLLEAHIARQKLFDEKRQLEAVDSVQHREQDDEQHQQQQQHQKQKPKPQDLQEEGVAGPAHQAWSSTRHALEHFNVSRLVAAVTGTNSGASSSTSTPAVSGTGTGTSSGAGPATSSSTNSGTSTNTNTGTGVASSWLQSLAASKNHLLRPRSNQTPNQRQHQHQHQHHQGALARVHSDFKKTFTLRVTLLAAKGLQLRSASHRAHAYVTALLEQKVYADLSVMPHSACGVYCRTGGQPRAPSVVFREEFIFNRLDHSAQALLVVLSMKSAIDVTETHLGHCLVPLDRVQFAQSRGEQTLVAWFPLHDTRSGSRIPHASAQLSLELLVT